MAVRELVGERRRSYHTTSPDRVGMRDAVAVLWDVLPARCPHCGCGSYWRNVDGDAACTACATTFHSRGRGI